MLWREYFYKVKTQLEYNVSIESGAYDEAYLFSDSLTKMPLGKEYYFNLSHKETLALQYQVRDHHQNLIYMSNMSKKPLEIGAAIYLLPAIGASGILFVLEDFKRESTFKEKELIEEIEAF